MRDGTSNAGPQVGKTIQRLRQAYNLSLGDLAEQSGVSKSIISQIERNEANPTLSTIWRLSQALDTTVEDVLKPDHDQNFMEGLAENTTPVIKSEDGLCTLRIHGPIDTVSWLQWYALEAEPGGVLESSPHPPGTLEHLTITQGTLKITVHGEERLGSAGETVRYRGDLPHRIECLGTSPAVAWMVLERKPRLTE